ncbi:hypothetical protein B0A48_10161 [Cryoendolithus antarcticus]|uniref:Major facilitator superfamily (MFS) profile domain-containing protein n=1 Tax=Cryoendolithus antarcticus TaxID=1507870 RepID=A0A1V8SWE1_9PEZI|nr:hypothetical protein B0A48_10161 [Cryoendolithus antarcticus]
MPPPSTSATWTGHPRIRGASEPLQLFLLTASLIGLQFCWGTEMTYCTPFLLSLGLSKSSLSLVWVAGPLSGLIMQPVIGMISDRWTGRWGRRRPFMVGGTVGVVILLGVLGWCEGLVGAFGGGRGATIVVAVVDIFVLDFVINIVQSTCRSLIVDTLPVEKQQLGSAWGMYISPPRSLELTGLGHLMVYAVGSLDLVALLGPTFLGDTQFKKVCAIAALAIAVAQGVTCWAVSERVLVSSGTEKDGSSKSATTIVKDLYKTTMNLPPPIQAICWVQFWSWIGWFPFLFYSSTWVGEIYMRYDAPEQASPVSSSDALSDVGRVGSRALIVFAFVSFAFSILLPYIARTSDDGPPYTPRPPQSLEPILKGVRLPSSWKPTLPAAWMIANVLFAITMIFAPVVHSVHFATILVAICGLPWSIGGWASFALMGTEINRLSTSLPQSQGNTTSSYRQLSTTDEMEMTSDPSPPRTLHLRHDSEADADVHTSTGELAGVYLGILNLYTTLPQFVGTGISTIVFSILEPGKSPELAQHAPPEEHHSAEGVSGIGVCLFIGAVCAMWAAWKCRKLGGTW